MTKLNNDATGWYGDFFKVWAKQHGPKPSADQLDAMHCLGLKPGKQALACAMALRDCGVTGPQIVLACGAPQLNRMRGLIDDKLVARLPASPDAVQGKTHTVYKLVITPKGQKRIDTKRAQLAAGEAEAQGQVTTPAKVKRTSKAAKPSKRASADSLPVVSPVAEVSGPNLAISDDGQVTALPVVTEVPRNELT